MTYRRLSGPEVFTFSPNRPPKRICIRCSMRNHENCIAPKCECKTKKHPIRPKGPTR